MKKTILYIIILVIGGLFVACSEESCPSGQSEKVETVVRIQATINTLNGQLEPNLKTRATGTVDESNSDYQEGIEDGNSNENAVSIIRLFAFDIYTGNKVENVLFRAPGKTISGDEKNFTFSGGVITNIQMDMNILSGTYRFVLVANEETAWNLAAVTSYSELSNSPALLGLTNIVTDVEKLQIKVANESGIPMIGEASITVKADAHATEQNPQLVSPRILLKRTISKVEVYLRNTDESGNVIDWAELYKIKSVAVKNANQIYNLFESSQYIATEVNWESISNVVHNAGEIINRNILTNYLGERKNVTESTATHVEITLDGTGQEFVYTIPLYQLESDGITKDYNIYRNTIYRINTILKGRELEVEVIVNYKILDYQNIITTDTNNPGIVNLDRDILIQDIETTSGHLYYNFKSYDVDATSYMEYVKTTLHDKEGEEFEAEIEQVEDGLFKYTLNDVITVEEVDEFRGMWIYLHFRNNKIKGENNMIAIAVMLYTPET